MDVNVHWNRFFGGTEMRNFSALALAAFGLVMMSTSAFATPVSVPEPMSMSLVFGGVAVIAAVRRLRRK